MTSQSPLKVAIQMDAIETINIASDSSMALGLEAQARGYELYHYFPEHLSLQKNRLTTRCCPITLRPEVGNHYDIGEYETCCIDEFDIVLMRQDPPFDMAYITATHLLEHAGAKTLVMNNPAEVRNAPEKILVMKYPELMPPTLISKDPQAIAEFRKEHKNIIIKPLYGNGGSQIFHIREDSNNFDPILETFEELYREPFMIQKFLPDVKNGDKRVILVDGDVAGGINRIPNEGEIRANMHVGGQAHKTGLSARDLEICEAIGPELKRRGLVFTGIDIIGDYITEINVTSPTGILAMNKFDGIKVEAQLWDAYERHYERLVS
jgi:glutathione synthase